jgi:hypothetical protein
MSLSASYRASCVGWSCVKCRVRVGRRPRRGAEGRPEAEGGCLGAWSLVVAAAGGGRRPRAVWSAKAFQSQRELLAAMQQRYSHSSARIAHSSKKQ